ncbi:MliC family protein [Caulobacter sp. NIBR1757]|uniref:MliC family protein n=1 Tax=Caulobacter sp. NIBR1757 TaxID=3016000 RepID=UPI0022F0E97C|nr:MliC family protein [Caulobacter sp. NIBR1757]WGM41254.1 hypothetical protein AMEJIAPC_04205 [Caulobacter sp. NIBR1757]
MTPRLAALLIGPLLLAACASTDGPRASRPIPPASAPTTASRPALPPAAKSALAAPGTNADSLVYRCAGGKRFTAAWGLPGDRVKVTAGGTSQLLAARPAASGARYGEGPFQIWGRGDEAMLEGFPGGPYTGCRTD